MAQGCICAGSGKSTGRPDCVTVRGITTGMAFGRWKNDDGDINAFNQGTIIDQTEIESRVNDLDLSRRLYILHNLKRVLHDRGDDITEDMGNGNMVTTGEKAPRIHTYELIGSDATEEMLAALRSHFCSTVGFHELTNFGQITGTNTGDGNLKRTKVMDNTFKAKIVYAQEGVIQKIVFSFIVDETEDDAQQDYITAESIEFATRFWYDVQPLQVLITEVLSTALDTIVVKLSWMRVRYENDGIEDFVSNDFNAGGGVATVNNLTQSTTPSVVAAESTDPDEQGQYTLTLAAPQTDQDRIEIGIVKDGYYADKIIVFIGPTS